MSSQESQATLIYLRKFCRPFFIFSLSHTLYVYNLPCGPFPSPSSPGASPFLLSDSQLCCSQAVKPFDHRTKAILGLKQYCLGGKQGWRSPGPLMLGQVSYEWRAKGILLAGAFPEPPSSAGAQIYLSLLTKRCQKLFKGFVLKPQECDLQQRVSWILSDVSGRKGRQRRWRETALHVLGAQEKGGMK